MGKQSGHISIKILLFSLLVFSTQALAVDPVYNQDGLAIGGYDPVAYFTRGRAIWGNPDIAHNWQGARWQFDNDKHRELFKANPEKYAPQYGGYCAYAAAKGSIAPTDARAWSIVDGKLYLNYSPTVQDRWKQNMHGYISRADSKWPRIKNRQ